MVPKEGRKKAFFTTNLGRPLTPELIEGVLSANLHHINISIESLREDRANYLSGAKNFSSFKSNLYKLAERYKDLPRDRRPRLYYITMILRENHDELKEIVDLTQGKLFAYRNELRTPFVDDYENMGWNYGQFLTEAECAELRSWLRKENLKLLLRNVLKAPLSEKKAMLYKPLIYAIESEEALPKRTEGSKEGTEAEPVNEPEAAATEISNEADAAKTSQTETQPKAAASERYDIRHELCVVTIPEYLFVRCDARGELHFLGLDEKLDINSLEDVEGELRKRLNRLSERRLRAFLCKKGYDISALHPADLTVNVDMASEDEQAIGLRGWIRGDRELLSEDRDILMEACGSLFYVKTDPAPGLRSICGEGEDIVYFYCYMDKSRLKGKSFPARLIFAEADCPKADRAGESFTIRLAGT